MRTSYQIRNLLLPQEYIALPTVPSVDLRIGGGNNDIKDCSQLDQRELCN